MNILGINFNHPETSVVLFMNNEIVFGIEEERLNRIKNFSGFPVLGIKYILNKYNLTLDDIDFIVTNNDKYYNLSAKFFHLFKNFQFSSFILNKIFERRKSIIDYFNLYFDYNVEKKVKNFSHHLCHAASAYYTSNFKDCNIVSFDGFGNFSSLEIYTAENGKFHLHKKNYFPHSLGLFYQAITQFLGFKDYGDEYKVMALGAYGKNSYEKELDKLVSFNNYKINLDLKYFTHHKRKLFMYEDGFPVFPNLYSEELTNLLGNPRNPNEPIDQKYKDLAKSLQVVFEKVSLEIIKHSYELNKNLNLILTGGCAMNSLFNGKVLEKTNYKNLFINNVSSDSGGAIGAISLFSGKQKIKNHVFIGPSFSNKEIKNDIDKLKDKLNSKNIIFIDDEEKINEIIVDNLEKSKLVGIFRGNMEFGPRALGNRSLIANPKIKNVKELINSKIKIREEFRPYACSVLSGHLSQYFETGKDKEFYLMNKVLNVKKGYENKIPGVIHEDLTSRIQAVDEKSNKRFNDLIKKFYLKTGLPMILNTSLNSEEPICCTPKDAINFFLKTKIDLMVIENYLIFR